VIIRGEQDIADHVAAGRLGAEDAAAVHTFATFLRELGGRSYREALADPPWRARWRGYVLGDADGPATSHGAAGCSPSPDDPQSAATPRGGPVDG
jgi:hypothetical protein